MTLADRRCVAGAKKLSAEEVRALSTEVPGWSVRGDRLERTFDLGSFAAAIAFVNRVAAIAEAEDHHPDMDIRYAKVAIGLSTHDAGGLTENDFVLAAKIDEAAR